MANVSSKEKTKDPLPKMLICPSRDLRVESKIEIVVAENLVELINMIQSDAYIVSVGDMRLVSMMVKYHDMFGVEFAVLSGVPGCDYSPIWDNETWSLEKVGYDTLVVEVETADMLERLKQEEGPASRSRKKTPVDKPLTPEDVGKLKTPSAFNVNIPGQEEGVEVDGDEQL